MVLGPLATSRS